MKKIVQVCYSQGGKLASGNFEIEGKGMPIAVTLEAIFNQYNGSLKSGESPRFVKMIRTTKIKIVE